MPGIRIIVKTRGQGCSRAEQYEICSWQGVSDSGLFPTVSFIWVKGKVRLSVSNKNYQHPILAMCTVTDITVYYDDQGRIFLYQEMLRYHVILSDTPLPTRNCTSIYSCEKQLKISNQSFDLDNGKLKKYFHRFNSNIIFLTWKSNCFRHCWCLHCIGSLVNSESVIIDLAPWLASVRSSLPGTEYRTCTVQCLLSSAVQGNGSIIYLW